MGRPQGHWVWFEDITTDIDRSAAFYAEVLGWRRIDMDMGKSKYTALAATAGGHDGPNAEWFVSDARSSTRCASSGTK